MKKPEINLTLANFQVPLDVKSTRRVLAYLLRATVLRVSSKKIGEARFKKLAQELANALLPLAVSSNTPLGFYQALCTRFSVEASGCEEGWGPIHAWLPEGTLRWDLALAAMDYSVVRQVIQESPDFLATFARDKDQEGEDTLFDLFPDPLEEGQYVPELPRNVIRPLGYSAVLTLTSHLHHGADTKQGNVSLFRRHPVRDPLTGRTSDVPFVSGNAIRGLWRDIAMSRWLSLLGLKASDIPTSKAHALFAGGAVAMGADSSSVNNEVRRRARAMCPPWDLLAGNISQQIMSGRGRIGDAVLVCRENAWLVKDRISPGGSLESFAETLPWADSTTHVRQSVRNRHADLEGAEGIQMLFNQELVTKGNQMLHTIQVWGIEGVDIVTLSCLADVINRFQELGAVAASSARGFGQFILDAYVPEPGTQELPTPEAYLEYVQEHREAMIEWALEPAEMPKKVKAPKTKKAKQA